MPVSYRELNAGFSTADAERPSLEFGNGTLDLHFVDWQEQSVSIRFIDVAAFSWQDDAKLPANVRDDLPYEVVESPWLQELCELRAAWDQYRHFKLCFNACGVFDVVAAALSVETTPHRQAS